MQLQEILFSQGFGTRRICAGLIQHGHVAVAGRGITDATADFDPEGLRFVVDGVEWPYHEKAYLMLHKPAGTECSRKPSAYPSIYTLLPAPLRQRPQKGATQGVQAVGRLDQDTTGLLLLTDDGQFIHRMSSPRHHVPKVYEVTARHPVDERQIGRLLDGVVLEDDPRPGAGRGLRAHGGRPPAADPHRRQVPPGQADDCCRRQPGGALCTDRGSGGWSCRRTCCRDSGAGCPPADLAALEP